MTELPTTFGKYFLTDKLATGGMAEIFLAKLIGPGGFEKAMVIKQIHPALSSQRTFVDLFVAEAKTLVSLSQSNIVPVYELGVVDDTYFIAMEYIDGPTLWQLTDAVFARGDALPPAIAAHVAAEIAKGLDYAHRKGLGVIHRDLSPRNVMLTRDGEVKLVDFGIAVALGEGPDASDGGLPTGSFPYMSPEQAAGLALTGQTDLFSLGVLTWEMLTGRRLFTGDDAEATLAAVAAAPIPRPSELQPGVPARLDAIVMRALARDRTERWATAAELGAALQRFLADETDLRGGRDLAALVGRVCPPTIGAATAAGHEAPATYHDDAEPPDPDAGPSTQVVPRSRPRGKRRPTVREATFATHVELERALAPVTSAGAASPPPLAGDASPATTLRTIPTPGRARWLAGLAVAVAIAGIAVVVVRAWRPPPPVAARAVDASPAPVAVVDAAPAVDAAVIVPVVVDAGVRDAREIAAPPRDARAPGVDAAAAATGRLRVGANPWGEVFLDGKRLGRAPNEWTVAAGRHQVEVVFPSDDTEVRRRFDVTVPAGASASVLADFTTP